MPIIDRRFKQGSDEFPDWKWDENRGEIKENDKQHLYYAERTFALVKDEYVQPAGMGFKINRPEKPLLNSLRNSINRQVNNKKSQILRRYSPKVKDFIKSNNEVTDEEIEKELPKEWKSLDNLGWPERDSVNLETIESRGFSKQFQFSSATGFSIGAGFVITVGHTTSNWSAEKFKDYWLIFGACGKDVFKKTFTQDQVFKIKRLVHQVYDRHQSHVITNDPTKPLYTFDDMKALSNSYDFSILECSPVAMKNSASAMFSRALDGSQASRIQPLKGLVLDPNPVLTTDDHRLITLGCPHNLSLKIAINGRVKNIPDPQQLLENQGTIKAAIDIFKGNSGGPLIIENTSRVIGICHSGPTLSFLESGQISMGQGNEPKKSYNPFEKLNSKLQLWLAERTPGIVIDRSWLYAYTELRPLPDQSFFFPKGEGFTWIRFNEDHKAIIHGNAFTRTDPFAHFSNKLEDFTENFRGNLSLDVTVFFSEMIHELENNVFLEIRTQKGSFQGSILQPPKPPKPPTDSFYGTQSMMWMFNAGEEIANTPVESDIGYLPRRLQDCEGGLCSWESLAINYIPGQSGQKTEIKPTRGNVIAKFQLPDGQGQYKDRNKSFKFQIPGEDAPKLDFKGLEIPGGGVEWVADIGQSFEKPNNAYWTGPLNS